MGKKRKKSTAHRVPPLSKLDKAIYTVIAVLLVVLSILAIFGWIQLHDRIAFRDPAVIAYDPGSSYYAALPLFLLLYLVSGLCGNLLSYAVETRSGKNKISAGASGAIFGLLGSYLIFALLPGYGGVSLYGILRVLGINAFYAFANRGINAIAHLGGLIGGIAVTLILLLLF